MTLPRLGVVLVAFNSSDVILDCLASLLASTGVELTIAVVDNASTDDTVAALTAFAAGPSAHGLPAGLPFTLAPPQLFALGGEPGPSGHRVTLIRSGVNGGFAGGVNIGLAALAARPELDRFWVLNPDSLVPPGTARAFAAHPGGFALLGGRVIYLQGGHDIIQIDGGVIDRRTGITRNAGQMQRHAETPPADPARLDFITGASMVASRSFYEAAGPMPEDYFLYYEEVEWALRRGTMPLAYCAEGIVYHIGGTAIGSPVPGRDSTAFSHYFRNRSRLKFVRRCLPGALPGALAWSAAKAGQLMLKGHGAEARALLRGSLGLPPPASVRARLSPDAQRLAFGS